jgi:hypothetical protein
MDSEPFDERQEEFPFMQSLKEKADTQKMEALYRVRTYDCSADRHQVQPNGICMLCKRQVQHGSKEDDVG